MSLSKEEIIEIIKENKEYFVKNDLEGFYNTIFELGYEYDTGRITEFLLNLGVNPLKYMSYVPENFLCDSTVVKSFEIPNRILKIKEYAFFSCELLESIEIPDGIKELDFRSFAFCENLKSVKLPNSLEKIGEEVFYHCENLIDINIPKNLKKVDSSSFAGCPKKTQEKFKDYMND